ncbi:MAG TPA: hypothetical protein VIC25_06990 [Caulobacteraceae bacterium]|jgi:hypothetical protein
MAERTFEMDLDRLFGEHPVFADAELFAQRVEDRLERGWTFRNLLIGGLGLAGGLVAAIQLMGYGVIPRLEGLSQHYAPNVEVNWTDVTLAHVLPGGLQVNGEILWMSAFMALAAIGFAVARAVRDF